MNEHCDRCGTELAENQHRHQRFEFEAIEESGEMKTGRLCADCAVDFRQWLDEW